MASSIDRGRAAARQADATASRPYVPLWVKSHYSFLEGASEPDELIGHAKQLGLPALAITDRDGMYGAVRALVAARHHGQRVLYGAQVSVTRTPEDGAAPGTIVPPPWERPTDVEPVILLAADREGYGEICELLTIGRHRCPKGQSRVTLEEVVAHGKGVIALSPGPTWLGALREGLGERVFAMVTRHRSEVDLAHEQALREQASRTQVPVVAGTEVLYHDAQRRPLADVLTCIRHGCTLMEAGRRLRGNAEHALLSVIEMRRRFADDPAALDRTLEIAQGCSFDLGEIRYRYPGERLPEGVAEGDHLRDLTYAGARTRYGDVIPEDVRAQLERELELVSELEYGGYFLTMHEIVRYCRQQGILCQGRGSAANSVVCFCLGITAIDPVRMDLLFERFLSRERAEPPDIDLDIEHAHREQVIAHVYEKYGRRHAAMVANVIRYRARSAVRDVGKVLGLSPGELDAAARLLGHYEAEIDPAMLTAAGLAPNAPTTHHLLTLSRELLGFPRHLSIHPGGFLLGHEPIATLVPVEPATMPGRTVIQWDKQDVDDLGLFKVDLLGLGCLTAIRGALDLLRKHEAMDLEIGTIPAEDPETYAMCSRADTVGVFQIESRAQMAMLPRLRPATFYDLVIEVALVRPGPIQGDMVHPYLRRRAGAEPVDVPHPSLRRVLAKTLGVPIFQEQVMKLAVIAADYTPGEADGLRRDMAAWRSKGRIDRHRERLIPRMVEKGIAREFAERVFQQILGFGEYGFPESHAASFALLAYVTAWLKCHHPAAFTCAMLNAQPMGFYAVSTLVEDVKRHGVEVRPICVNHSDWDCTLEASKSEQGGPYAIRMGLRWVQGLGAREREVLEAHRGPWPSIQAFARATRLPSDSLISLARAGAFDTLVGDRRQALWAVRGLAKIARDRLDLPVTEGQVQLPLLTLDERVLWDYRASHHSTRGHPMARFRARLSRWGIPAAGDLTRMRDGGRLDYVGVVITRQRPHTASGVTFLTLEDETGFVNVVLWRAVFDRHEVLARSAALLGVRGKLQIEEGVRHLIADELYAPEFLLPAGSGPSSRDFH